MAYIPWAPEVGAFYEIFGSDGTKATFNDTTDPDFCGVLSDVTGLDSADVRDAGDVLVEADGGYQGTNYYGRRPITLQGTMYGYDDIAARNVQMAKIRRATHAMDANGFMYVTGDAATRMIIAFRRQQPTRFSGAWIKTFNISLVSSIVPLLNASPTTTAAASSVTIENQGDYTKYPPDMITITGYSTGTLVITNTTTGGVIQFTSGLALLGGHTLQLFPQTHQLWDVTLGAWANAFIDYVNSTWFGLATGNNTITTNLGTIAVTYHSAWL